MSEHQLTREELYERIWKTGTSQLVREFGVTYSAFVRLCRQLNIPRPSQVYWAQVRLGRPGAKTPLPPVPPGMSDTITFSPPDRKSGAPVLPGERKQRAPKVSAPGELRNAHTFVRNTWDHLKQTTYTDAKGRLEPPHKGECLHVTVSRAQARRALLFFDSVLRECGRRGWRVHIPESTYYRKYPETFAVVDGQQVKLALIERAVRRRGSDSGHDPLEKSAVRGADWTCTGLFCFGIGAQGFDSPFAVEEKQNKPIEERLDEVFENIHRSAERSKAQDLEWAEQRRRNAEQARVQLERQREHERELQRRVDLERQAQRWQETERLRAFIAAAERDLAQTHSADTAATQWLAWARAHADRIDPIRNGNVVQVIATLASNSTASQNPRPPAEPE